jgi:hypothetical protein
MKQDREQKKQDRSVFPPKTETIPNTSKNLINRLGKALYNRVFRQSHLNVERIPKKSHNTSGTEPLRGIII